MECSTTWEFMESQGWSGKENLGMLCLPWEKWRISQGLLSIFLLLIHTYLFWYLSNGRFIHFLKFHLSDHRYDFYRSVGGYHFLYADTFLTREEFEKMFDLTAYEIVRKKYFAEGIVLKHLSVF